jgi:hypothetical protein
LQVFCFVVIDDSFTENGTKLVLDGAEAHGHTELFVGKIKRRPTIVLVK